MKWITRAEIGLIFITLLVKQAYAGPPFLTNDTDVTAYHQFEFYLSSIIYNNSTGLYIQSPATEIDWGFLPNLEASITLPYSIWLPTGNASNAVGLGDGTVSLEYRFIQESTYIPAVAIAPMLTVPTGDASRNLGNGTIQTQLPIWFE